MTTDFWRIQEESERLESIDVVIRPAPMPSPKPQYSTQRPQINRIQKSDEKNVMKTPQKSEQSTAKKPYRPQTCMTTTAKKQDMPGAFTENINRSPCHLSLCPVPTIIQAPSPAKASSPAKPTQMPKRATYENIELSPTKVIKYMVEQPEHRLVRRQHLCEQELNIIRNDQRSTAHLLKQEAIKRVQCFA